MIDEALDEMLILGKYIHPNKEGVLIDVADLKQAIKEAMCDARGHLHPISFKIVDKPEGGAKLMFDKNPCKYCGKEKP